MTTAIDLRVAALLAARICHDLIGPIAAIGNGAELLVEDDAAFARDAALLVGDSARQASARLQFFRFAYGFGGGAPSGPAPHRLAAEFFAETGIDCDYRPELRAASPERQKLACAMLLAAGDALPRGGRLIAATGLVGIDIAASGPGTGPSEELRAALALAGSAAELTSRTVVGYHAALLAEALGLRLAVADCPGGFRLTAAPC